MRSAIAVFLGLLYAGAAQAPETQIYFSRRVYQLRGKTYQQIWKFDVAAGQMTQLSRSPRDHELLACAADAKEITFSDDGYMDDASRWSFDIATGQERKSASKAMCRYGRISLPRPTNRRSPLRKMSTC